MALFTKMGNMEMTRYMENRLFILLFLLVSLFSADANSQQWTKISAETHYGLRVQIGLNKEWCVDDLDLHIEGKKIFVPPNALAGVCNVYLNGVWVSPETSVSQTGSSISWILNVPIMPIPGPKGVLDMNPDNMTTYEFGFDSRCLTMRRIFRGGSVTERGVKSNSTVRWACNPKQSQQN